MIRRGHALIAPRALGRLPGPLGVRAAASFAVAVLAGAAPSAARAQARPEAASSPATAPQPVASEGVQTLKFELAGLGVLELRAPSDWAWSVEPGSGDLSSTIVFVAPGSAGFELRISPIRFEGETEEVHEPARLREEAEKRASAASGGATSGPPVGPLAIEEIHGPEASGFLLTIPDAEGAPEGAPRRIEGVLSVRPFRLAATIVVPGPDAPELRAARYLLRTAHRAAPPGAPAAAAAVPPPPPPHREVRVHFPGRDWDILLDLPGYEVQPQRILPNATGVVLDAADPAGGVALSLVLEPSAGDGDAREARDFLWRRASRSPLPRTDVRLTEREHAPTVEFVVRDASDEERDEKHVIAYAAHDGIWAELHLSKRGWLPEEWPLFDDVIASLRVVERAPGPQGDGPPPGSSE